MHRIGLSRLVLSAVFLLFSHLSLHSDSPEHPPLFPLRVSDNHRYLVDQTGTPFLVHGDSAWSLIVQLDLNETALYLDRRKAQGFNSILTNLIEHRFADNPPLDAFGETPFGQPGDFSKPDDRYFSHAAAVIELAARRGMAVFLVPAYLGIGGDEEGWYHEIRKTGRETLRQYGTYLGRKYGGFPNIVWVLGGDFTPPLLDRWTVDELAAGIREGGSRQLMTAHCGQEPPAIHFGNRGWLDLNNVYSYAPELSPALRSEYERRPIRPFILIESIYEGDYRASAQRIRRQAYTTLLNGAAGHFFGSNPVWNFSSPVKGFPTQVAWQTALDSQGSVDMSYVWRFFSRLKWAELLPEGGDRFVARLTGESDSIPAVAAATRDGNLLVIYILDGGSGRLTLDLSSFAGDLRAFWYDPTCGMNTTAAIVTSPSNRQVSISIPGNNSSGERDWLLVVHSGDK